MLQLKPRAHKYVKLSVQIILCVLLLFLGGCSANKEEKVVSSTESVIEQAASSELVCCFPEELSEYVIREQSTYGSAKTETFYIKNGDAAIPLFRIDMGDRNLGDWLGVLKTSDGDIPVTYTVFAISEEDMASLGENAEELYDNLMSGFNEVLEGIFNDPRFSSEKPIEVGDVENVSLTFGSVDLPENMWITENIEGGNYEAVFFCQIQKEDVALYTVRIGDAKAETELGLFKMNGEQKPISVASFDLPEKPNWSEEDYSMAYHMMGTINDVIQQIMSNKYYSAPDVE